MRLLILLREPPRNDAHHGGAKTLARGLSVLADRYEIGLLTMRGPGELPVDDALRQRCAFVEEVERKPISRRLRSLRVLLAARPGGLPTGAAAYASAEFLAKLEEILAGWTPDVVQAEQEPMAQYLTYVPVGGARRVLVAHESQALLAFEIARLPGLRRALRSRFEAVAWRRFERAAAATLDGAVTFTDRDCGRLRSLAPQATVARITPLVPIPAAPADPLGTSPPRLLFIGMFLHLPNADAAQTLVGSILPKVQRSSPAARLELVGPYLPSSLQAAQENGVDAVGEVPDVWPFLDRAAVVTAPISIGSGVRIKLLEALAAGKAVVASPRAAEGIAVPGDDHLLVADGDDAFATAVVELLRDPDRRGQLARAARKWAQRELTAARYEREYAAFYEELLH
jgi:glycosyltransferase involved in cell wall biosynthesis